MSAVPAGQRKLAENFGRRMDAEEVRELGQRLPWSGDRPNGPRPSRVDLRKWLPRVFNQGMQPLCTAVVVAGLAEYLQLRVHGVERQASLLFNYRTSRMLAGAPDRQGSFLHHALRAWAEFGLAEEPTWPCVPDAVNTDPPADRFAAAREWREDRFFRVDQEGIDPADYLEALRETLAAELPVSIDFPIHLDLARSFQSGVVTLPGPESRTFARHVVLLCGYDDDRPTDGGVGAFLLQNCWGGEWGDNGFGWLPYEAVLSGQTRCSWSVTATIEPGANP